MYGLEHSLNKYEGTLFSSKWQKWLKKSDGAIPMFWWSDSGFSYEVNCPICRHSPTEPLWWWLPSPIGNQAKIPVRRRWGIQPHCLPAHLQKSPCVTSVVNLVHTEATDRGHEPEELLCCPGSDLFPELTVGTSPVENIFPLPSFSFLGILQRTP